MSYIFLLPEAMPINFFAEHPHRYNLYGLSDMLSVYKIENAGIQVEDKDLRELASPFVAHVSNDFVVVRQMSDQAVDYVWREKRDICACR